MENNQERKSPESSEHTHEHKIVWHHNILGEYDSFMTFGKCGLKAYSSQSCSGIKTKGRNKIRNWGGETWENGCAPDNQAGIHCIHHEDLDEGIRPRNLMVIGISLT